MIKVIGIGNRLMGDDGVALVVLEKIQDEILLLQGEMEVIIGETDFVYCLNRISDNDFIIIIDSTSLGLEAGKVTVMPLEESSKYAKQPAYQHESSLVNMIGDYKSGIRGYLIGIEINNINFSSTVSVVLGARLKDICKDVLNYIKMIKSIIELGEQHA